MDGMRTDWYYHIGDQHLRNGSPCQDYALAGVEKDMAFAIVADGCSSGGKTDIGARITALSARRALDEEPWIAYEQVDELHAGAVRLRQELYMETGRTLFSLEHHDMLSTSAVAVVTPRGGYVRVYGDAVVALVHNDGSRLLYEYEWQNNMPYYLGYGNELVASFIEAHGGDLTRACCIERVYTNDEPEPVITLRSLAEGLHGFHLSLSPQDVQSMALAAVFSDGAGQVCGVGLAEAVRTFLAYKTTAPGFVKRRVKRALADYARAGHATIDDIACAAILRVQDKEE